MDIQATTFWGRTALWVVSHKRLAGAIFLISSLLCALVASARVRVDSNILNLMPKDSPATVALENLNAKEGGVATVTITVQGGDAETRHAWLRKVAGELEQLPEVRYTFHEMDPKLAWRIGLFHLEPTELATIRDRLKGAIALGPAMANPFLAQRLLAMGPLTEKVKKAALYTRLNPSEDMSRLLIRPNGQAADLPFSRSLMANLYRIVDEADAEKDGLQVAWIGGAYRHTVEDYEGIVRDVKVTSIAAMIMVILAIGLAFRQPRAVLLLFIPNLVSNLWTVGFAGIFLPTLNTFTSFFNAIVIGLGINFGIHLFSRYREERLTAGSVEEAVVRAWDRSGLPTWSAAATTAAGFFALCLARFRGFRELGVLAGVGVLLTLTATLVVLPLMLAWLDRKAPTASTSAADTGTARSSSTYSWAPLSMVALVAATALAILQIPNVQFQHDISELRRRGMAWSDLTETQQNLAQDSYAPIVVTYPTAQALQEGQARVAADIASGKLPQIAQVLSLYSVVPADQADRLPVLNEIAELMRHENARYLPEVIRANLAPLAEEGQVQPLTVDELPISLRSMLGAEGDDHRMLLMAQGNMWDLRETEKLHDSISAYFGETPAAGEYLALGNLYKLMRLDGPRITLLGLLMVGLLTWLDLRRPGKTLGAMAALLAGTAWAAAAIVLFQIKLSMVNMVGISLLFGMGIDVCIHLAHRLSHEGPGRIRVTLKTTGWAAALASLTNILAFACIITATSQGVRSLGMLVSVGLAAMTLATFLSMPLGYSVWWWLQARRASR